MKIKALGSVLAKRFGVAVAQELVPSHPTLGDVDSQQALTDYQAAKRAHKAEWRAKASIDVRTLTDGGQPAEDTAHALADFLGAAQRTLEIAIYDLHLPPALQTIVVGAIEDAQKRGVAVRLAYNVDHAKTIPVPPPPQHDPAAVESLPFPTAAIPGIPDLMHHKYVVRDQASVWTGSTNWTGDSWTREENVIVTVDSPELAARYGVDFEQLWTRRDVQHSGKVDTSPLLVSDTSVRAVVLPGPRRAARAPHREGDRHGDAPRAHRVTRHLVGPDPRHARAGRLGRKGRRRRRRRPDAGARGAPSMARERQRRRGRSRCSGRRSRRRRSRASTRPRTGPAPSTTTCTRR